MAGRVVPRIKHQLLNTTHLETQHEASGWASCLELRKSSSVALRPQTTDDRTLTGKSHVKSRKLLVLLMLWTWLAALDDFRNWLIRGAAQSGRFLPVFVWVSRDAFG